MPLLVPLLKWELLRHRNQDPPLEIALKDNNAITSLNQYTRKDILVRILTNMLPTNLSPQTDRPPHLLDMCPRDRDHLHFRRRTLPSPKPHQL